MDRRITHACGHQQTHYLPGLAGERDRKARWLATTSCRTCFVADKRAIETAAAAEARLALASLHLPDLHGSGRQVTWATSIRSLRLGAMVPDLVAIDTAQDDGWFRVTDAKWWIDNRDVAGPELPARAVAHKAVG